MRETTLNIIADNAWQAHQMGLPKFNPYRAGSLEHIAYEKGWSMPGASVD